MQLPTISTSDSCYTKLRLCNVVTTKEIMLVHEDYRHDTSRSWTDDLEVCKLSGIGFATNQVYRQDGARQEDHEFEDRCFHYKFDNDNYLYAVMDGHEGWQAVHFCFQRIAAEILLGQLSDTSTDEEIKEVLRQAFISVENSYMERIDYLLAMKTKLMDDLPEGLSLYEAYPQVPETVRDIKKINCELSSGTAAALALIYNKKLYVANIGNCRVLLCKTDVNNVLRVVQLSVDHDLKNEDEVLRLSQLGLNPNNLRRSLRLGNQDNTRCLGNYMVKGGYKDFEDLSSASQCPIISDPDVHGGIKIDDSCRFLLLMSSGLFRSVAEGTGTDEVNKYITKLVHEQGQATLPGVAQAVVDSVVRYHQDWSMLNTPRSHVMKRDDITLVVRNFNYPLPNAQRSPTTPTVTFNPVVQTQNISNNYTSVESSNDATDNSNNATNTNTTTSSSEPQNEFDAGLGPDEKIPAYVDFSEYYQKIAIARNNGTLPPGIDF